MNILDHKFTEDEKKDTEPSLRIGISSSTVAAIVTIILYLAPGISNEVLTILTILIVIGIPILSSILIRRKVWSPSSVSEIIETASVLVKAANRERPQRRYNIEKDKFITGIAQVPRSYPYKEE